MSSEEEVIMLAIAIYACIMILLFSNLLLR